MPNVSSFQSSEDLIGLDIAPDILELLPIEVLEKHTCLPIQRSGTTLTVVVADTENRAVSDDVHFLTGYQVKLIEAPKAAIKAAIRRHLVVPAQNQKERYKSLPPGSYELLDLPLMDFVPTRVFEGILRARHECTWSGCDVDAGSAPELVMLEWERVLVPLVYLLKSNMAFPRDPEDTALLATWKLEELGLTLDRPARVKGFIVEAFETGGYGPQTIYGICFEKIEQ